MANSAAAVVIAGLLVAAGAGPASAADPIGLSLDGTSFDRELPDGLFAGARIVPGSTIVRSFWVKNQQTTTGNLALAVQDVAGEAALISGLAITASINATAASPVELGEANPCTPLFSAVVLPADGVIRIDVSVALANRDGLEAQGAVGDFTLRVTLTSTDVPAPDGCGPAPAPPVDPPPAASGADSGGDTAVYIDGFGGGSVTPPQDGGRVDAGGGDPGRSNPRGGEARMNGNTARLYQEYVVAAWLAAMVLGGISAWGWRRRPQEENA